jgi:hypothetical protein
MLQTKSGKQLYWMLPEVYRTRDNTDEQQLGDLAKFLDGCGELLDLLRNTLDQRLADSFPAGSIDERSCQAWILPYFAQLLDVHLTSPSDEGRRLEVGSAVAWRQQKGTSECIEEIAQAVSQLDVEIQEGWRRVATTPRIGMPLLPADVFGEYEQFEEDKFLAHPAHASRHPGLPIVTVDFRNISRSVRTGEDPEKVSKYQSAKLTSFDGKETWWYQLNPHGAPCFPNSYADVSKRTVDIREPDWRKGHFHPKRLMIFVPTYRGFFDPNGCEEMVYRKNPKKLVEDTDHPPLLNRIINSTVTVEAGRIQIKNCAIKKLVINSEATSVDEQDRILPVLEARDCLFDEVIVNKIGIPRLEYCTIMKNFETGYIQASDCLFAGNLSVSEPGGLNCIRFSRIPQGTILPGRPDFDKIISNTTSMPVFFKKTEAGTTIGTSFKSLSFGDPGYGVLHPATDESIRFGAEDSGEMGAYHHKMYCLFYAAVLNKLEQFLPIGFEATLVPDSLLHNLPVSVE